jgi:hypothetical protein
VSDLGRPFSGIVICEVSDGPFFINDLFQRKFGSAAPGYGRSVIAFYRDADGVIWPLCYTNFLKHDEVILVGGAMTDGNVFRRMPSGLAEEIRTAGGIYLHLLKYAFDRMKDDCVAFFGHAGDPRAYEVDLQAGFEPTSHRHLIAYFHKPLPTDIRRKLIEKIHAIGPF